MVYGSQMATHLTFGRMADTSAASALLVAVGQRPRGGLADKGHDSDELRAEVYFQGSQLIISRTSNHKQPGALDPARYAKRNSIERVTADSSSFGASLPP
jgi:hypothetical protein